MPSRSVFLGLALTGLAVALFVGSTSAASPGGLPDEDKQRLRDLRFRDVEVAHVTSPAAAQQLVTGLFDADRIGAKVTTYKATITALDTLRGKDPIVDRPVWIVRFSDFETEEPGPVFGDGSRGPSHFLHRAYSFVDATTGEFLYSEWQE
jgi:hypothetical protein